MPARSVDGRVVVVTGASSGVGRAVAHAFAERRCKVALLARNVEALGNAAEEVRARGGEPLVLPTDVSDPGAVDAAARAVVDAWGRIDIWVNDAMVSVFSPFKEMTAEEFRRVTEVSYLGYVYGTQAALRHMLPRDDGVIVQIGSALAYRSIPLQSAYCGAKSAIRGFSDSVRTELVHDRSRVRICMVQLPAVNTPQFDVVRSRLPKHAQPVPPPYQPEVIARGVLYAAAHAPRELWIGWSTWKAIVGQKLIPRLLGIYLGLTGYRSQQTDKIPKRVGRPDNLEHPVPWDPGTYGDFNAIARRHSSELWMRTHPGWVALGAVGLAGAAVLGLRAARA